MAVTRNDSNSPLPYFGPLSGISAYANRGGEIFHYVSNQTNPYDVLNATYRVHVFDRTGDQSIYFDRAGSVDVLLIAGGGSGGTVYESYQAGGGGGAGGLLESYNVAVSTGETRLHVAAGGISTSHAGDGAITLPYKGENSTFGSLAAIGGSFGGSRGNVYAATRSGGSGGGASDANVSTPQYGGQGVPGQGNPGGDTLVTWDVAAGGGGAGEPGASITDTGVMGHGGDGRAVAFYSNTEYYYSGGGAGGTSRTGYGNPTGGLGGGGSNIVGYARNGGPAEYYGGGGGGAMATTSNAWYAGGSGYQGLVMVRYRIG